MLSSSVYVMGKALSDKLSCMQTDLVSKVQIHCSFQSVILPVYNAEKWLDETIKSMQQQKFEGKFELSVYNDASKVGTIFFSYTCKMKLFSFQNNPKNLDPPYKMDLDF